MTEAERLDALEQRIKVFEDFFTFGRSVDGRVPWCKTAGRFGVMTKYQSELPWGEGFAFSVDSECDAGLGYFEFAPTSTANARPKVGVFVHVVGDNPQKNVAFHARVGGSREANVALLVESTNEKTGIELGFGVLEFWIGRIGGVLKKLWPAVMLAILSASCISTIPPPPPPPAQTVAFDLIACAAPEVDGWCPGIAGAVGRLDKVPGSFKFNDDGFVWLSHVPKDLGTTELVIDAPGFEHFDSGPFPLSRLVETNTGGAHNAFFPKALAPAHVDPASVPLSKILAFRGSLFTVVANCNLPMFLPSGQRVPVVPFAPLWASPEQRQCSYDLWKARGYTHGVKGPGIDPGYHQQTPSVDFRSDGGAAFMAQLEAEWDQGFVPITVVVPDHLGPEQGWAEHIWTVAELQALEPIYRSARFQRLARVVMLCWECQGSQYGWSNRKYLEYGAWFKDVFPNSIRILHTIADIEAPVGDGDETNTANCHGLGPDRCLSVADAWTRVGQFFRVWFEQSSALFDPNHVADNGKTDSENWLRLLWDKSNPGSLVRRFGEGGVWSGSGILPIPAEYLSYLAWNGRSTEDNARTWGDKAIDAGAPGYMDGGTVAPPVPKGRR